MNSVIEKAKRDSAVRTSNLGRERLSREQTEKVVSENWETASLKDTK